MRRGGGVRGGFGWMMPVLLLRLFSFLGGSTKRSERRAYLRALDNKQTTKLTNALFKNSTAATPDGGLVASRP